MLTPEYLHNVPERMVNLYAQVEADILADMARRISTYDYWIPAAEHQAKMLEEAGMTREDILKRLNRLTGKSQKELKELMQEAGTVALKSDDEVYRRAGLDPAPIGASKDLQAVLQAGYDKTAATFQNLTQTTARTATQQFERVLDRAYMQITTGGFDYNTAVRSAIKQLSADGVGAIRYPSGKVDSVEVAVRRAAITGVNQTALRLQDARAGELGSDLVEVSAHSGARPEHAEWQGEIYSRSGKSKKYPNFVKVTGYGTGAGLGGWNCSHSFRPWFEGMSRTYSKEILEDYNAKKFEYNGKKLTEYEALQEQRKLERNIRRWKREQNALRAAGLDTSEATAKVKEWNGKHKDFLEQTGLKADGSRLAVGKRSYFTVPRMELLKEPERIYSKDELDRIAIKTKEIADKYILKPSKWSGNIVIDDEQDPKTEYGKLWNCDIKTRSKTAPHIILHEQLHAKSISYFDEKIYRRYAKIEEASVQLVAQEISVKENIIVIKSAYDDMTDALREINKFLVIGETDLDFALKLFETDVTMRESWIRNHISDKMDILTIEDAGNLQDLMDMLF